MRRVVPILLTLMVLALPAAAEMRFPAPEFKRQDYTLPPTVVPPPRHPAMSYVDVALLLGALALGTYLVYVKRSRRGVFLLMIGSLAYFGFYRMGCVCPVGSIQNVAASTAGHVPLTWLVAAFFILPLAFALFVGRVFCAGVCPLGAIQDMVLWRPIRVPAWLEQALGLFPFFYLGLAVLYAVAGSRFIICEYDPFVSFFRLSGPAHILLLGGVMLLLGMFVGRAYCRFICPYSVLLRWLSMIAGKRVSITPRNCIDCRLCEQACPFGAIRHPTPTGARHDPSAGRGVLVGLLVALPLIVAILAWLGYLAGPTLAQGDFVVRLAQRIALEERQLVEDVTDESEAFRGTGEPVEALYARAATIQRHFAIGGAMLGAFMGAVIGLRLIGHAVRRRREGYTTDPAGCLACARCYKSCPVELELRQELAVSRI